MDDDRIAIDIDPDVADVTGAIPTLDTPPPAEAKTPLAETVPPDEDDGQGALPFVEDDVQPPPAKQAKADEDPDADLNEPDAPEVHYQRRLTETEQALRAMEIENIQRLAESEAQRLSVMRDAAKMKIEDIGYRLEIAHTNLVMAEEADDARAKVEIQKSISGLETIKSQLEAGLAQTPDPDHIRQQAYQAIQQRMAEAPRGTSIAPNVRATNPHAERWATANPWMSKTGPAQDYVIDISQKMMAKGWDPTRPDFYAELSTRVARKFPDIKVASGSQPVQPSRQRPSAASPVVAPSRGAGAVMGAPQRSPNRYRFTQSEARAMANMGFDPTNKDHISAWAKERLRSAARAQ